MLTHNVDITDRQTGSKWPFAYESTLKLPDGIMFTGDFAGGFVSIKVYVNEKLSLPVRIDCITPDRRVLFSDRNGAFVAQWQLYEDSEPTPYVSSVLLNENNVISGHVVCKQETVDVLMGIMRTLSKTLYLDSDAFVLLPQCHVMSLLGSCRSFGFRHDGETELRTSDVSIQVTPDVLQQQEPGVLWFHLKNSDQWKDKNTVLDSVLQVVINGSTYWTGNQSIILKAGIQSNLRLTQQGKTITLKGVANV